MCKCTFKFWKQSYSSFHKFYFVISGCRKAYIWKQVLLLKDNFFVNLKVWITETVRFFYEFVSVRNWDYIDNFTPFPLSLLAGISFLKWNALYIFTYFILLCCLVFCKQSVGIKKIHFFMVICILTFKTKIKIVIEKAHTRQIYGVTQKQITYLQFPRFVFCDKPNVILFVRPCLLWNRMHSHLPN